jgi:hypothetical protein
LLQVFFELTDKHGVTHDPNPKPYEFDEAAVFALFNSREICYPLISTVGDGGRVIRGQAATIENTVFDLFQGVPVLRIKLLEKKGGAKNYCKWFSAIKSKNYSNPMN